MKKIGIFGLLILAASCGPRPKIKQTMFTHQIVVTYNDAKTDTIRFTSVKTEGKGLTPTGCTIWLANKSLHIIGCEECDVTGISRCDVRKFDHKITEKKETFVEQQ